MASFLRKLSRRKTHGLDEELNEHGSPKLARVLGPLDLIFLGIGSTLGVGVYVLAGEVAKSSAGPAVCISFLVAAVASAFAAVCYAEFGARVPKAGSAYVYSYVTVGELMAFVIGWNLILEYLIGTASVAKSFSENFDKLLNKSMSDAFLNTFPINAEGLGSYVDWFSFSVTLVLAGLLAFGMKGSSMFTNVFTVVNLVNVTLVIIAGLFFVDGANWNLSFNTTGNETLSAEVGEGGFAPFGFAGIMDGAATCFFAFVGFDSIAATSEEAKNPRRDIPLSIMTTLLVVFLAYFGVSTVLTLMVPYYLQDPNTPLVSAFYNVGEEELAITISIGSLFGISASLLGAMIPLPRIVYAMSRDGLVFRILGKINKKTQTPILATAVLGVFAAVLSMIFDLGALIDMMSIGTLLAYSLVAVSVLIIRFTHYDDEDEPLKSDSDSVEKPSRGALLNWLGETTKRSQMIAYILIGVYCILCTALALVLVLGESAIQKGDPGMLAVAGIIGALLIVNLIGLSFQPRSRRSVYFMVPLVPLIPCLSVFINIYLMMRLSSATWIRFAIWMAVGFLIYFFYGVWFSSEEYVSKGKAVPGEGPAPPNGEANKGYIGEEQIEMTAAAGTPDTQNVMGAAAAANGEIDGERGNGNVNGAGLRKFQTLEALHQADTLLTQDSDSIISDDSSDGVEDLHNKIQSIMNGTVKPAKNPDYVPAQIVVKEKSIVVAKTPQLTDEQIEAANAVTVMQTAIHFKLLKIFPASVQHQVSEVDPLHAKLQQIFDGTYELAKAPIFIPIPCIPKAAPPTTPQAAIPNEAQTQPDPLHKKIQELFAYDGRNDPLHVKLRLIFAGLQALVASIPFEPVPLERKAPVIDMPSPGLDPNLITMIVPLIQKVHLTVLAYFMQRRIPKDKPNILPMMDELRSKVIEKPAEEFQYEIPAEALTQPKKQVIVPVSPVNKEMVSALKNAFANRQEKDEGVDVQGAMLPSHIHERINLVTVSS